LPFNDAIYLVSRWWAAGRSFERTPICRSTTRSTLYRVG